MALSQTLDIPTPRWFLPLLEKARYKGAHGGRGSGKSHAFAEYIIERCLMSKCDVVCIREVQKSLAQSVKKLLEIKIEALGLNGMFEVQQSQIKGPHGGVIVFQGMQNHTADSIKSLEGFDIAWVEEAQSLSQRSLDLLRPTIRKPGSEILFTWNPDQPTDPIDAFLRCDNPPPDSIVVEVNYNDNPWFPEVLRNEMEYDRGRDHDKYMHVWEGQYSTGGESRVFKNWSVEEFDAKPDAVLRFGADWGFANDPTVLVRCYIEGRKLYVDHEAWMIGCDIQDTPSLFLTVPESTRWPIVADSSRPETISHMKKNGFIKVMPAVKGPGSVEDGIEFLRSHDIIVHPRCKHLIDELKHYRYKTDQLTGQILPQFEDKHNHVIDALRYACEAVRKTKQYGNYQVVTRQTTWNVI